MDGPQEGMHPPFFYTLPGTYVCFLTTSVVVCSPEKKTPLQNLPTINPLTRRAVPAVQNRDTLGSTAVFHSMELRNASSMAISAVHDLGILRVCVYSQYPAVHESPNTAVHVAPETIFFRKYLTLFPGTITSIGSIGGRLLMFFRTDTNVVMHEEGTSWAGYAYVDCSSQRQNGTEMSYFSTDTYSDAVTQEE